MTEGASTASVCPRTVDCELFPLLTKPGFLRVWQINYCEADFSRCQRYQRSVCGKHVAVTLLPNGQELAVLAKEKK
jgi:hypothetical protein